MRGVRSTLAMLIVFLSLAAYVYFVELERRPASEEPPNEQVFEIESDAIVDLTLSVDGNETILTKSDSGDWELTAPVEANAADDSVSAMTSRLASLEIKRVVSEESMDLRPFGLSTPRLEVSLRTADGDVEDRLLIGETTPTGTERYAKLASSDRVIMVESGLDRVFRKTTFDLRDKTILDIEALDVDHVEVDVTDSTIGFDKLDGDWRMVDPWNVRADYSTVQGLVGRLSSGQMQSVVSEDPMLDAEGEVDPLESYGLSDPAATATVRAGSATATLRLGSAVSSARYAQDASRSLVFTVEESLGTDIERGPGEYRDKSLFGFRPFNAQRFEVIRQDATTVFEKTQTEPESEDEEAEEAWRRVAPNTADVERSEMDDLLAGFSNLRAESFVESRSEIGLDDSNLLATVVAQYEPSSSDDDVDPMEERVRLWRSGEDTYAVHGDEPGAAIVETKSVDDALEALEPAD